MNPLGPPDSFHLSAVQGWIELGNPVEANEELEKITPELRAHPDVPKVRWGIYGAAKQWEAAFDIASALIQLAPDEALGWIYRSYALHEQKRSGEARDNLLRVADKFPRNATIHCNLACYECQLGRLDQAREWLQKALERGRKRS